MTALPGEILDGGGKLRDRGSLTLAHKALHPVRLTSCNVRGVCSSSLTVNEGMGNKGREKRRDER